MLNTTELKRPINEAFGIRVRQLRYAMKLTQGELGKKADLHLNFISDIERGKKNPSLFTIEALSSAFNMTVSELFENI